MKRILILFFLFIMANIARAETVILVSENNSVVEIEIENGTNINQIDLKKPIPWLLTKLKKDDQRKTRITAAILAIALGPFGVHRLYLGTKPYVPAVYVATVGGGIGILPFIDFIVLVFTKDITPYMNNNKVFMWANK